VGAHSPAGDSVFGIADLVGNVWQWCNVAQDARTRAAVLRGSSYYSPQAPEQWYFPAALELDSHGKYLLMSDSYDRAGTVGFRCVVDYSGDSSIGSSSSADSAPPLAAPGSPD